MNLAQTGHTLAEVSPEPCTVGVPLHLVGYWNLLENLYRNNSPALIAQST